MFGFSSSKLSSNFSALGIFMMKRESFESFLLAFGFLSDDPFRGLAILATKQL